MSDQIKIQNMLILDEDRQKEITVEYPGGKEKFTIKALFPKDNKEIARRLAMDYNGLPVSSYSVDDRYLFERDATIDQGVVEGPEWWSAAEDCAKDEVNETLFKAIKEHTEDFNKKLKKNKFVRRGPEPEV